MTLEITEIVITVGAISLGSPSHRTIARLTPSSLELGNASSATMATAKAPNSCGPRMRASATPIPSVLKRATILLRKLQPSALVARPASCLLYTSDAADDLLCVDLGGRRIIN